MEQSRLAFTAKIPLRATSKAARRLVADGWRVVDVFAIDVLCSRDEGGSLLTTSVLLFQLVDVQLHSQLVDETHLGQ